MKKILSIVLTLVMLASAMAVSTSAAGQMYVQTDFTSMETLAAHFHAGAYYIEDEGLLFGYDEAKCLQSKGEWYQYDTEIEVNFNDDDLSENSRAYSLWYCNINLDAYGRYDGTNYMKFGYSIDDQEFYLTAGDLDSEETIDLMDRVPGELADDEYHLLGISVSEKRLRCFANGKLIFDFVDAADDYLIGRQDENTNPTPLVFWNDGNFIQIKGVKVSTPGFLYPFEMEGETTEATTTVGGENNVTSVNTEATTTPKVTTTATSIVEVTNEKGEQVTDESGNKVTSQVVITEAPDTAATNTGKPAGGSSTSTGDATFAVVAAMVATLGCAIIVKKVNA